MARCITDEDVPALPVSHGKVLDLAGQPEATDYTVWYKVIVQYLYNNRVRGDTETSYAKYLGYLDAHDLYPDLKVKTLAESIRKAFAGGTDFAAHVGHHSFWVGLESLPCSEKI